MSALQFLRENDVQPDTWIGFAYSGGSNPGTRRAVQFVGMHELRSGAAGFRATHEGRPKTYELAKWAQVLGEDHAPFGLEEHETTPAERGRRGISVAQGGGRERARAGADVPGRRLLRGSSSTQGSQLRHHLANLRRSTAE
jgi:hypothetical protein